MTDPPILEKPVQLSIVAPLLFLADFYMPPFQVKAERSVEITAEDEAVVIRGSLDILVLKQRLWLLVIEAKQLAFSTEAGLAQLLAYMLAVPDQQPCYGLITNGASFLFVKLIQAELQAERCCYATSAQFNLRNPGNELHKVLRILKKIGRL